MRVLTAMRDHAHFEWGTIPGSMYLDVYRHGLTTSAAANAWTIQAWVLDPGHMLNAFKEVSTFVIVRVPYFVRAHTICHICFPNIAIFESSLWFRIVFSFLLPLFSLPFVFDVNARNSELYIPTFSLHPICFSFDHKFSEIISR